MVHALFTGNAVRLHAASVQNNGMDRVSLAVLIGCAVVAYILATRPRPRPPAAQAADRVLRVDLAGREPDPEAGRDLDARR